MANPVSVRFLTTLSLYADYDQILDGSPADMHTYDPALFGHTHQNDTTELLL